jgi:hypothetical protein
VFIFFKFLIPNPFFFRSCNKIPLNHMIFHNRTSSLPKETSLFLQRIEIDSFMKSKQRHIIYQSTI